MARRCVVFDGLAVITGGQVTRAKAFLQRFRKYDPLSRLVVLRSQGNWIPTEERLGLEVIDVSLPRGSFRAVGRMLWQNLRLPGLLKRLDANVYLSFSHYLPATMPSRVMTIMGVANFAPFSELAKQAEVTSKGKLRLATLKRTILSSAKRARRVIALSEALQRELVRLGVNEEKIVVIPNGVEVPAQLDTALDGGGEINQCGVSGEFLLYVSHFYRYKNFERLIRAYAGLSHELRDQFALVLIGEPHDKEYYREVEALIDLLGMRGRVVIVPGLPSRDLVGFYRTASLFVFPSLVENSPNILLEAMACGVPVLASQIEPMPEFGQEAVRYVDPLDVESMTKEITVLLADPEARELLGQRARVQARRFTWDDFTAKVVGLYDRA
jgi:glycosyltransferase involved in cell wall biosynthesis